MENKSGEGSLVRERGRTQGDRDGLNQAQASAITQVKYARAAQLKLTLLLYYHPLCLPYSY